MGSSIPLPALDIRPAQAPDALGSFEKLMALRSLGNQQQLQQQQLVNEQQQSQLRQQQIADQQLTQQYLRTNKDATFADAADALKGKISVPTYTNLMDTDATIRQKHAAATKDDLDNLDKVHQQQQRLYNNASNLSDQQLAQQSPQIVGEFNAIPGNNAKLDPSQPLTKDKLSQFGVALGLQEAYLKQEQDKRKEVAATTESQAKAASETATAEEKRQQSAWYQAHGGAPGVAAEVQQQAAWLARPENKGKDAADFLAWKAKQSPMAMVMGNLLGNGGSGSALDQAAQRYLESGEIPQGFGRSPGTTTAILNRAAQLDPNADIAANKVNLAANKTSLQNLQKSFDQVSAFEGTAQKNLDLFLDKLSQIPDLQVKFANIPLRRIDEHMIGSDNFQAMKAAQQTAAAEAAKVLSSANASGVLSDTQKKEAEQMLSGDLSYSAAQKVVATLKQDFANRHQSYQDQIADIQRRIGKHEQTPEQNPPTKPSGAFDWSKMPQH